MVGSAAGYQLLELIPQSYRTMIVVAKCTGLRAEEVLALEWQDIDFENLSLKVVRAVVHGRVKMVKTEYSEDELPLDPDFAAVFLSWKIQSKEKEKSEDKTHLKWVGPPLSQHRNRQALPHSADSTGLYPSCWMLSGGLSEVGAAAGTWCWQDGKTPNGGRLPIHEERREAEGKYDG